MSDEYKVGRVTLGPGVTGGMPASIFASVVVTVHAGWCPKMTAAGDPKCVCSPEARERFNAGLEAAAFMCEQAGQTQVAETIRAMRR